MHQLISFCKKYWFLLAVFVFSLSRFYIFTNPPEYVRYFEEYANIWYYGVPPYFQHWFEYPPLTIPFISGPLLADLNGIGDYRTNFRVMTLTVDVLLFLLILKVMQKLKYSNGVKLLNALFYIAITTKAKDFMYENLDLLFAVTLFLPAVSPLLLQKGKVFLQWFMYWLGIGLKLVNAPLGLLYFFDSKKPLLSRLIIPLVTFALLWGLPLGIFRSSLSVILVYHKDRQLQVESFPSLIVRGINNFTKSEEIYFSQYKSFDLRGPISEKVLPLSTLAMVIFMGVLAVYIFKNRDRVNDPAYMMKVTLIFIFGYFMTNKVFSTPYHLWYLPLLVVYPYRSWKERTFFYVIVAVFLGVATSRIPSIEVVKGIFLDANLPVVTQIPATLLLLWATCRLKTDQPAEAVISMKADAQVSAFQAALKKSAKANTHKKKKR
ncbi:hypothetical protein H3C66_03025 [Patescibacteria group bacterium]|nr:hypothetical protein [Patescibacteria group bacterium]